MIGCGQAPSEEQQWLHDLYSNGFINTDFCFYKEQTLLGVRQKHLTIFIKIIIKKIMINH